MIVESCQTAIEKDKVFLKFEMEEVAQQFYDSLQVCRQLYKVELNLKKKMITFNFDTEKDAKEFHQELIKEFGER